MQPNRVKRILREGGLALGTYVGGIADPQIVEIIGHAGYDAAFIDMEHTSFDLRDVQLMVLAAERVGIKPIVRTTGFDPAFILRLRARPARRWRRCVMRPWATGGWPAPAGPRTTAGSRWRSTWPSPTGRSRWR